MAKDSFFIRARVKCDSSFTEQPIDLGAFVDALGKSILKIKTIQVKWEGDNSPFLSNLIAGDSRSSAWQLTTQHQNGMVSATDKAVISTGRLREAEFTTSEFQSEVHDINVQDWDSNYLVGVDTIYLGGMAVVSGAAAADNYAALVIECEVGKLSPSAAMSLALSQQ